ncbi:hypothetical protein AM493_09510 [Flavobacterium akiainvivens]|uniref:Cell surface protein n=1 Tax=Flavobacterium akiainvivens TaxID=1202724 RepID=A0A0M9VI36_9FLAO|nr:DUF5074 domain-containing protein [Flavobacterium akiainvivens]KOS06240.1 hypothetical protein AM493_09510 [Flavobacterium akiainvivens]SFQ18140.1 40-residue YVTN family beta-propeller repeat-containing protein [Flavobacterium akiainvivens]
MKLNKLLLTAIAGGFFFVSCNNDDDATPDTPRGAYDNGFFVLNQGNFGMGNASISFISDAMQVENNIFATNNNNAILGDTGQDIGFHDDKAYIVLNGSNRIEIVNRYSFEHITTIEEELVNPRYIAFYENKAYVTNWGDGSNTEDDFVAVIDLATNTVTSKISVIEGPERIVEENNKLYVSHMGGYGYGSTVSVINPSTGAVQTSITTGGLPGFIEEEDNKLYILSEGFPIWSGTETPGKLQVVNASNHTVTATFDFTGIQHPSNLIVEDDYIYYTIDNKVYRMAINATALPTEPLFTAEGGFPYGISALEIENGSFYIADEGNFIANGTVYVYSMQGALQHTFSAGLGPVGLYDND